MSRQQVQTLRNYFGGRWVPAETDEVLEVHNPATDEVLAHVPLSGGADVDAAVAAAAAAFPAWRATPPQERARYFFKLRQLLDEHREELARRIQPRWASPSMMHAARCSAGSWISKRP